MARGRLAHAYLFAGAHLGELEAVAGALAKVLNCRAPQNGAGVSLPVDSCDQCDSCRRIEAANHPDVRWVRPESKLRVITIDQTRELMGGIQLKPTEAKFKVAVIVAADRLNHQAANAFLKTLEEPPARSILILLSVEPGRIIDTIRSRCLRLEFSRDGRVDLDGAQMSLLQAFGEVVTGRECGLMDRYRLLGITLRQLAAIKSEVESALTDRSPLETADEVDPELRERWEEELAAAIEAEYRRRRLELLAALHWWFRDIWLQTLSVGAGLSSLPQLEAASRAVAGRLNSNQAGFNLELINRVQRSLHTNVQEALALEVGFLNLKM